MPPRKLAFVLARYFDYGGLQRDMRRIAERCLQRGHVVHVYTCRWDGRQIPGVAVHTVDCRAISNPGKDAALARAVSAARSAEHYDAVVGFNKIAGLDVYYAADPCFIAQAHETKSLAYRLNPRYWLRRNQEAVVFARGAKTEVLLIAPGEREKFIRYYRTEPERIHLLPPGINRERLRASAPGGNDGPALRAELGLADEDCLLLMVASKFRTKGVDRAIKALAALPIALRRRTRLAILGEDDREPFLALARRLGIGEQILFLGAREDVARYYRGADLLIHPAYTENTGTVLLEAMVCGLPVLTTANCGFAYHVEQAKAGIVLSEPYRQQGLDEALARMLASSELEAWSRNGVAYGERTDLYSMPERAVELIERYAGAGS